MARLAALALALLLAGSSARATEPQGSVAFLPGKKSFVYATDGEVWVSGLTGKCIYSQPGRIVALAVSPEGTLVASCSHEEFCIWDLVRDREVVRFKHHANSLAFSSDGGRLATAGPTGVLIWNAATGEQVSVLPEEENNAAHRVAFVSGRASLAVGRYTNISLYDPATCRLAYRFKGLDGSTSLAVSADGRRIATTDSREVKVWEGATGSELLSLTTKTDHLDCAAFGSCGRRLAFATDLSIKVWDIVDGKYVACLPSNHRVDSIAISDDGRLLASAGSGGMNLWTLDEHKPYAPGDAQSLFKDLRSRDAKAASRAVYALAADAKQSLPFLRETFRKVHHDDLDRLVADLDSKQFAVRQKASAELEALGEAAAPALRKLLATKPPLEVRRRAERLLEQLEVPNLSYEALQVLRGVEVLERMASPEATRLLEELAAGQSEARLTQEAKAALARTPRK